MMAAMVLDGVAGATLLLVVSGLGDMAARLARDLSSLTLAGEAGAERRGEARTSSAQQRAARGNTMPSYCKDREELHCLDWNGVEHTCLLAEVRVHGTYSDS